MAVADDTSEVLVFYAPLKLPWYVLFRRSMPVLAIWVCERGFWQRFNEPNVSGLDRMVGVRWKHQPADYFGGRWGYA